MIFEISGTGYANCHAFINLTGIPTSIVWPDLVGLGWAITSSLPPGKSGPRNISIITQPVAKP